MDIGPTISAEFDAKASSYESNRLAPWYRAQARVVLDELDTIEGPILDVGCGTGFLLRELLDRYSDGEGVGVDLSQGMIRAARELSSEAGLDRLSFVKADWEDEDTQALIRNSLPAPPGLVVCVSAFHYFSDPKGALARIRDTLAPGGRLLLLDRAMDGSAATLMWDLLHRHLIRDQVRFYRTSEIVALLREAGFVQVGVVRRIRRLFWHGKLYTSLILISARCEAVAAESGACG